MTEGEGNGDESDKYLEAQDRRYSGFQNSVKSRMVLVMIQAFLPKA